VKVPLAVVVLTLAVTAWVPVFNWGTMMEAVKLPTSLVAGTGAGRTSMPPISSVVRVENVLKPEPVMVKGVPTVPELLSTVRIARGTSWVAPVVTVVLLKVYSARTELVEGIAASNGTVKEPVMLPDESGVKVATVLVSVGTVYLMVTEGVESAPDLVLSAG